jgi:cytidine deaminase
MKLTSIHIPVEVYADFKLLEPAHAELLEAARKATAHAFAPYSRFKVGAAVRLANGNILTGANQENASFPAGICAERVTLSSASANFPGISVTDMAISYMSDTGKNNRPISPCGICRQTLAEYEQRFGGPIRLIMGGMSGEIYIVNRATDLLPFAFNSEGLLSL